MHHKKKVLLFIDWFEPAVKAGGPVRSIINMVALTHAHIHYYIVCGDRDLGDTTSYPNIALNTWIEKPHCTVIYLDKAHQNKKQYTQFITELVPDSIYINGLFSLPFSITPLWVAQQLNVDKIIIAPRGMLGSGALELKWVKKKLFLWGMNLLTKYAYVQWHATSTEEAKEVQQNIPYASLIHTISNITIAPPNVAVAHKNTNELRLLFISRISIKKNLAQAIAIVQQCIAQGTNVSLDIHGPVEDTAYWNTTQSTIIHTHNIQYKGVLQPYEFEATFPNYHALLFPTQHENYGHVIAEALSYSLPVLISNQTPWQNLAQHKAGMDISLSDTDAFVKQITEFYTMNNAQFNEWQKGAQLHFTNTINTTQLKNEYLHLFN